MHDLHVAYNMHQQCEMKAQRTPKSLRRCWSCFEVGEGVCPKPTAAAEGLHKLCFGAP
jgi:hypothetical protein